MFFAAIVLLLYVNFLRAHPGSEGFLRPIVPLSFAQPTLMSVSSRVRS
jgi:hypothetical protein